MRWRWSRHPDAREAGEERRTTIEDLSIQCCGYCAQARRGEPCQPITETGKTPIGDLCRWRDKGQWEGLLNKLMKEPDFEWLMIDASYVKAHAHAACRCSSRLAATAGNPANTMLTSDKVRHLVEMPSAPLPFWPPFRSAVPSSGLKSHDNML